MSHSPLNNGSPDLNPRDSLPPSVPTPPPPPPVAATPLRPRPVSPQAESLQSVPARNASLVVPTLSRPGIPQAVGASRSIESSTPSSSTTAVATGAKRELTPTELALAKLRNRQKLGWIAKIPGFPLVEHWIIPPEDAPIEEKFDAAERRRGAPAWLLSFVVHVVLLLILALIPFAVQVSNGIELMLATGDGGMGEEFSISADGGDVDLQTVALPELAVATPDMSSLANLEIKPSTTGPTVAQIGGDLSGMAVQQGLSGRSGALKGALLGKFGGTKGTEDAVAAGLKWLAYHQLSDGGWSLTKHYSDGAANEDRTGATALALNAFLGAGNTHKEGQYKDNVARAIKFLVKRQDKEGFFAGGEPSHHQMYAQALATISVCEAYGMTGDSELKVPATRAIRFAEWSQSRLKGWRYEPRQDSDLSVTGWFLMALMTGKMAGLEPKEEVIKSVSEYLETVSHEYGARYAYQKPERPSLSMTAEGLLCRQYLGWPSTHPSLLKAIEVDLLPNAPDADAEMFSVYYWYYATQVLHHVGGSAWKEWNDKMKVVLPALQVKKGEEAGSWDPDKDQFGPSGGRLYVTCLNLYCLEVYYRHLALYDMKH